MNRVFFLESLEFEVNLIGYKDKGECIIFFVKADKKIVYSGLVDCYKNNLFDAVDSILKKEKIEYFNFICWTHPHDDHTIGMLDMLELYISEKTVFWMPKISSFDIEKYSDYSSEVYAKLLVKKCIPQELKIEKMTKKKWG